MAALVRTGEPMTLLLDQNQGFLKIPIFDETGKFLKLSIWSKNKVICLLS